MKFLPLKFSLKRNLKQIIKFSIVGLTGSVINFTFYFISVDFLQLGINSAALIAFMFAVTNNYILNHHWTFSEPNKVNRGLIKGYFIYFFVNFKSLLINLLVLNIIVKFYGHEYHMLGQLIGIALGMVSNYIYSKKLVFKSQLIS